MSTLVEQEAPARCYRLQSSDDDLYSVERADLEWMLALLYLVRSFEEKVLELQDAGLIHGPVHSSIGQEAVAAAFAVTLRRSDAIFTTHRAHGHFLAKALQYYAPDGYRPLTDPLTPSMQEVLNRTLAEIMGLQEGWCGGRGGSMHLCDVTSGNLGSNAIVGGGIPLATGAAWAQRFLKKDSIVVSSFGDGAINQGCFHEVANMAALWGIPVLYLLENNLYAVGTSVEKASFVQDLALRSLGHGFDSLIVDGMDCVAMYIAAKERIQCMRHERFPFLIEAKTYRRYHHGGHLPGSAFGYRSKEEEAGWLQKDPLENYPARLIRLGLVRQEDGERLQALAKSCVEQAVASCTTRHEGRLTIAMEKWPSPESMAENLRGVDEGLVPAQTVERADFAEFRPMTYVEAVASVTLRAMERNERVIVLGEEVANLRGGAYGATKGIEEAFPDRIFNTPISETGFVGMAGGLACVGLRPVAEIMFPDFALMASDQLFNQLAKLRYMYGGQIAFPVVLRTRVAIGFGYGGQHSMDPASLFALFPGWRIMAPSNAFDYIGMFNTAMRLNDPVLIIEHGMLYAQQDQVPVDGAGKALMDYAVAYGKANIVCPGGDVTVLTTLTGVQQCQQAARDLATKGIRAEVIDLRTLDLWGMDWRTIGESVKKTGSVLIVEQSPRSLCLGSRISDEIQERFFDFLDCAVGKVTAPDVPLPVSRKMEEEAIPSLNRIRAQMELAARHLL